MRGTSKEFQATVVRGHTAVTKVAVVRDGRIIALLPVHKGDVEADRTAAQMRTFTVEVSDPTGELTPEGMASLLAPFGTRLQIWRGVRLEDVTTVLFLADSADAWTIRTQYGLMNGVVADPGSGALRLGP